MDAAGVAGLVPVFEEARAIGLLGPGPVESHVRHATAYAEAYARLRAQVASPPDQTGHSVDALDLGSGAGVPGLVLALLWPRSRWTFLDAGHRRCEFLRRATAILGLTSRTVVLERRAEEAGRDPGHRGCYQLVTARGFGPPGVTAECAAPLLSVGGELLVSEPPEPNHERWPGSGLDELGLERLTVDGGDSARIFVARQVRSCPDRYPRRTGVALKRPLF